MLVTNSNLCAQAPPTNLPKNPVQPPSPTVASFFADAPYEFWLACLAILWGLIMLTTFVVSSLRSSSPNTEVIVRTMIVMVVVVATMILAIGGYSQEQTAAAYGLFGAIIGYIFGRMGRDAGDRQDGQSSSGSAERPDAP
jgi:magnesium-transporting ATPase (P-type)